VERVISEKLTGLQLTKKFLHCMEPELSLAYIIVLIKIEYHLLSIISGKLIAGWDLQYFGYCSRNYGITTRLNAYTGYILQSWLDRKRSFLM
jgi:hypothetical protein